MIDHIGFEVADLERAGAFYDAVFFALGARRMHETPAAIAYGVDRPVFWIVMRGRAAAGAGRYGHLAFRASGRAAVRAAYAAGLANGGSDDGAPAARPQYGASYFSAYMHDPDGLRVEVVSGSG